MIFLANFWLIFGFIYYIVNDLLFFINNDIIFMALYYNKYKFIDYFYYFYINFYYIYKIIKIFFVIVHYNILKFYIIFVNDILFFFVNNFILIFFLKCRRLFNKYFKLLNKGILKLNRKYKYHYRFGKASGLKIFMFLAMFFLFVLVWQNRTSYYKVYLFFYPIIFYVFVMLLCNIIAPFFNYNFIGVFFVMLIIFTIFLIKILY